jgi:hypothetical protein
LRHLYATKLRKVARRLLALSQAEKDLLFFIRVQYGPQNLKNVTKKTLRLGSMMFNSFSADIPTAANSSRKHFLI